MSQGEDASLSVSLFLYSFRGGGAEKMMVTLANELAHRDHEVDLVLVDDSGPNQSRVDPKVTQTVIGGNSLLSMISNLWKYLMRREQDVLLSTLELPNVASVVAGKATSVPVVLRIASVNSKRSRHGKYRLIPHLKRLSYPRADAIVAISDGVGRDVARITGMDPADTTTIYNPAYEPDVPELARKSVDLEWLTDHEKRVAIGVGHFKPQKDFATLIRAVDRVNDQQELYLVLLGEGELEQELRTLAKQLGIQDRVNFPGYVENPYAYMARANVFVLSSTFEGFGNVIVEAMACGTPVVSTDCPGGPTEILDGGTYGSLVPVGDDRAMAEAIRDQLSSPTDPDHLQSRVRDFSIEQVVDQYETVVRSVLE